MRDQHDLLFFLRIHEEADQQPPRPRGWRLRGLGALMDARSQGCGIWAVFYFFSIPQGPFKGLSSSNSHDLGCFLSLFPIAIIPFSSITSKKGRLTA